MTNKKTIKGSEREKTQEARQIAAQARKLLKSPDLFVRFLSAAEKTGLVGERRNALVLFVVTVSRLLDRPLNAIIKGPSSSGKNWMAKCVLDFLPKNCV